MAKDYYYKAAISEDAMLQSEGCERGTAKNKKALCDTIRELIAEGYTEIHISVIERE